MTSAPAIESADFSRLQITAVLLISVFGSVGAVVGPQLYGALAHDHRITLVQLGRAATLELFAKGLTVGVAGAWLKPDRLKAIALITTLSLAAAYWITGWISGEPILVVATFAGICEGLNLWILIGFLARTPVPARMSGFFIGLNGAVAFALASLYSYYVIPMRGATGGFSILALTGLVLLPSAIFLPGRYGALAGRSLTKLPDIRGITAVAAVFVYAAGITSLWAYVDPVGRRSGLDSHSIGVAISASIATHSGGGWISFLFARWIDPIAAISIAAGVNILMIILLWSGVPAIGFAAIISVFGFLWAFAVTFHIPLTLVADGSGRAAMLIGSAQQFGSGAGPAIAALFVSAAGASGALGASAMLFSLGAILALIIGLTT
jgi:MFS transporter, DHA1 family, inner membrane transport protein